MTAIVLLPLTERQEAIVTFMWAFFLENDQLPPAAEIARHFGFKTRSGAVDHLRYIKKKGFIEKNTVGAYRFTALFHAEQTSSTEAND